MTTPIDVIVSWVRYQARMFKHRPRMLWNRAFVRKNEFHNSLDMDVRSMYDMNTEDRQRYIADLIRRRNIAHERDIDS